jgi:hypothetical protein
MSRYLTRTGVTRSRILSWSVLCVASFAILGFPADAARAQSFSLSVAPAAVTLYPGEQNVPVTVSVGNSSYAGPVSITLTGLPSGITVAPLILTPGNSGTLLISAAVNADQEGFPPVHPVTVDPGIPTNTVAVSVYGAAGATQATTPLALTVSLGNPNYAPAASNINLPIVNINTNGVPINSKTVDVPGTITITSADGTISYLPNANDTDNTASFHIHGNSSAQMPKSPYHVSLNTSLDLLNVMGLECPYVTDHSGEPTCDKSKSYDLLANYDDKTMLRDWAAGQLANAIPIGGGYLNEPADSPTPSGTATLLPWAAHSLFVELYLNGAYEGAYQLIEAPKVDNHRINLVELEDTASGDLTGGYLLEFNHEADPGGYFFNTPQGLPIEVDDPDFEPENPAQMAYITGYVATAENALFSADFTDPTTGWRAYYDEASAVNYYIVNDLMGNTDGGDFYSSDYFYKNADNPLLYMGPIWDFDISTGNVDFATNVYPFQPWIQQQAIWYKQWFSDPGFAADVATQWNALKNNGVFANWMASIPVQAQTLQQTVINNTQRWPMLGMEVWPNPEAAGSYSGELAYMTGWLALRYGYLDSLFNSKAASTITFTAPLGTLRQGTPALLQAQVQGGSGTPTGTVGFHDGAVLLGTAQLDANGHASLTTTLPAGVQVLGALYAGDSTYSIAVSSPATVTVKNAWVSTTTSVAASALNGNDVTPVTFTMSVVGNSGSATPTGNFKLALNGQTLAAVTVGANGTASYSATLSAGTDTVAAAYSGDASYLGSTASPVTLTIVPAPDFTLAASPGSAGVVAGQSAGFNISLASEDGFMQAVTFACSGLPAGASCSFAPASVTPGTSPAQTTLTIATTSSSASASPRHRGGTLWPETGGAVALALLMWPARRRRWLNLLIVGAALATGTTLAGCGGGAPMQSTSTVVVTATGGGVTHTLNLSLTVTQ